MLDIVLDTVVQGGKPDSGADVGAAALMSLASSCHAMYDHVHAYMACRRGVLQRVLLAAVANPNASAGAAVPAYLQRHERMVLDRGVLWEAFDKAVSHCHQRAALCLLAAGGGCPPVSKLEAAAEKGLHALVRALLVDRIVDRNRAIAALECAAKAGHVETVNVLCNVLADESTDWVYDAWPVVSGSQALRMAAEEGHLEVVQCLLAHGTSILRLMRVDMAVLHGARRGHVQVVQALLSYLAHSQCDVAAVRAEVGRILPAVQAWASMPP